MISAVRAVQMLLEAADRQGRALTPLQIMKLVYISHGWHLAVHGRPLINEEVEAWQYGPVIPSVYHKLKKFGSQAVTHADLPRTHGLFDVDEPKDSTERSVIEDVYETLGNLSGPALSNLTHKPGSPWFSVWRPGERGLIIPDDAIRAHYIRIKEAGVIDSA
jgi:uncharacterized phage-associated protein